MRDGYAVQVLYLGEPILTIESATGYGDDVPAWLSVWLLIAADNIIHVICNALAIAALST